MAESVTRTAEAYAALEARFVTWAETVPDLRAAVIIGSRARRERPADEWSDLDLLIVTTDPGYYISTTAWLDAIGAYWLTFVEATSDGAGQERRVLFDGGLDVDFAPVPAEELERLASDPFAADLIRHGVRVLLDKDGVLTEALKQFSLPQPVESGPAQPPGEARFLNVINDFWYHAVWTAKKLRRGELWTAKGCVDSYLKWQCLLPMIEWHAHTVHGWDYGTWFRGRFLEQWADPRVVEGLREAYGRYDADDLWRALLATMDLFRWLAVETAARLGYPYPTRAEEKTAALVRKLFEER
jgi:aminoglycoside 6-adenylyltransferase